MHVRKTAVIILYSKHLPVSAYLQQRFGNHFLKIF